MVSGTCFHISFIFTFFWGDSFISTGWPHTASIAKEGFELSSLLLSPLECRDHRCILPYLTRVVLGIGLRALGTLEVSTSLNKPHMEFIISTWKQIMKVWAEGIGSRGTLLAHTEEFLDLRYVITGWSWAAKCTITVHLSVVVVTVFM